jgi:hypothetical protein
MTVMTGKNYSVPVHNIIDNNIEPQLQDQIRTLPTFRGSEGFGNCATTVRRNSYESL